MVFDVFLVDSPSGYNLGEISDIVQSTQQESECAQIMNMYIIRRRPKIEFCGSHFGYSVVMFRFFVVVCLFVCCCCCCCCCCLRMFKYMWYFYTSCWKPIFANIKKYWKSTDSVLGFENVNKDQNCDWLNFIFVQFSLENEDVYFIWHCIKMFISYL